MLRGASILSISGTQTFPAASGVTTARTTLQTGRRSRRTAGHATICWPWMTPIRRCSRTWGLPRDRSRNKYYEGQYQKQDEFLRPKAAALGLTLVPARQLSGRGGDISGELRPQKIERV